VNDTTFERFHSVSRHLAASGSLYESVASAVDQLVERTGAAAAALSAFSRDGEAIIELYSVGSISSKYPSGLRRPTDGSSTLLFAHDGPAALGVDEMEQYVKKGFKELSIFLADGFKRLYGAPVVLNGKTLGCIQLLGESPFNATSQETAIAYASLLAPYVALDISDLTAAESVKESLAVQKIAETLISEHRFEAVCDAVADSAGDAIGFDAMVVRTWDPALNEMSIAYRGGIVDPETIAGHSFALVESKLAPIARDMASPLLIDEGSPKVFDNPEYRPLLEEFPSFLIAPLMEKGEFMGTLELYSLNEYAYKEEDLRRIESLANLLTSGVAHFALINALSRQAEIRGFLAEVARLASAAGNLTELVTNISSELRKLIEADEIAFFIPANRLAPFKLDHASLSRHGVKVTGLGDAETPCSRMDDARTARVCGGADCATAELWESAAPHERGWIHLNREKQPFSHSNSALLAEFARHIAPAIDSVLSHGAELRLANERARADEAEASAAELQKQNEVKREFLATMSHELRTPLTPIRAFVDVLLHNAAENLTDRQTQQLTVVKRNVEWLNLLINDLLDVSRIESGRFELQYDEIEVQSLLNGLVESLSPLTSANGHRLKTIMPSRPITIQADNSRLSQVLGNLITNSIKYSAGGTLIRVAMRKEGDGVSFYVRDEGNGIPADQVPRMFELFARADTPASKGVSGSGIGLFVSKTIIESHGGHIGISSVEGHHTTVHFWVPSRISQAERAKDQRAA
jgi:signal transduction histidine kinase